MLNTTYTYYTSFFGKPHTVKLTFSPYVSRKDAYTCMQEAYEKVNFWYKKKPLRMDTLARLVYSCSVPFNSYLKGVTVKRGDKECTFEV